MARATQHRAALALCALFFVGIGAAWAPPTIVLLPACNDLPGKTCCGDHLNARRSAPDAAPDEACTTCLQGPACCDRVGDCDEDKGCVESFQATHLCVLEGGAPAEARCMSNLKSNSRDLYGCMRDNCAEQCGVPHCKLAPEVVLFSTPSCDRCMGPACCDAINECYGNRQCKLIVECVTNHCKNTLGPALVQLASAPPGTVDRVLQENCADDAAAASPAVGPTACIARCLDEFAPTQEDHRGRCLAFTVFACGVHQSCGPACSGADAGAYASGETWPEDVLPSTNAASDAGADAAP
jgi:hypothetical protein